MNIRFLILFLCLLPLTVTALPAQPTAVTTVSWVTPTTYTDQTPIVGVVTSKLYYRTTGDYSDINSFSLIGTSMEIADMALPDGDYMVTVTGEVNGIESAFSDEGSFSVIGGIPQVKQLVPAAPTNLTVD